MKMIPIIMLFIFILGCDIGPPVEPLWQSNQEERERIFFKCLEMIPEGPDKVKYNDWDDVISECGEQAYYMSKRKVR